MIVVGLHHAGLYVTSLARSIAFYQQVFGLEVAEQLTFDGEQIAFLRVGSTRLELIESGTVDSRPTGVVDHIALEVHGLANLAQDLRARGVTLVDPAPVAVAELHAHILFCLGPDGERIELFEYDGAVA